MTITYQKWETLMECRDTILDALEKEMEQRRRNPGSWIENERCAVHYAASYWIWDHGLGKKITVEDILRIEPRAVGHIDYASKLALYVAEFIYDLGN